MAPTVPPREVFSPSRRWRFRPAVVLALAAALSCGGDETMPPDPPEPARVTVSPGSLELAALRDTARLSAQVHDQYGDLMADAAVTWASSDASVASVDLDGLVESVGNGEAVVVAKAGSAADSAEVTVAQVVSAVTVSPEVLEFSALGDTLRLRAELVDANGYPVEGAVVAWSSDDAAVATVDASGLVSSVGNGEAMVVAAADPVSGTADVTVAQVVSAVTVSPATLEFSALGDTLRLGAEARGCERPHHSGGRIRLGVREQVYCCGGFVGARAVGAQRQRGGDGDLGVYFGQRHGDGGPGGSHGFRVAGNRAPHGSGRNPTA